MKICLLKLQHTNQLWVGCYEKYLLFDLFCFIQKWSFKLNDHLLHMP
jgi:hypothetical protein